MTKPNYAKIGDYSLDALMVVAAAREVNDGEIVFAGTGLPMLGVMAAMNFHAPNAKLVYEAGTTDSQPISLPSSVGGPRCGWGSAVISGMTDVFAMLQRGWVDLGFLGGAEVDKYGNVNTTCIGDYKHPKVRLPGSGGNPDINSLAKRTVYIMPQQKRRFNEQVSYVTSPGWRIKWWNEDGTMEWVSRKEIYGTKYPGGPHAIITDMAVLRFDEETGLMYLDTVHPGRTVQDVLDNVGFDLDVSRVSGETLPPTYEELDLLYNKIDPEGIFLL